MAATDEKFEQGFDDEDLIGLDDPDDLLEVLWPSDVQIAGFISRINQFVGKSGRNEGKRFWSVDIVARQDQADDELEKYAGTKLECIFCLERGENREWKRFVTGIGLDPKSKYRPSEIVDTPVLVIVRHGERTDRDTKEKVPAMFLREIILDGSVE